MKFLVNNKLCARGLGRGLAPQKRPFVLHRDLLSVYGHIGHEAMPAEQSVSLQCQTCNSITPAPWY